MQVITVADDGTVRIELTAYEAKAIRDDLANSRSRSPQSQEFARYVDLLSGKQSTPTFPGGGF